MSAANQNQHLSPPAPSSLSSPYGSLPTLSSPRTHDRRVCTKSLLQQLRLCCAKAITCLSHFLPLTENKSLYCCSPIPENICFPRLFLPPSFGRGFSRITSPLPTRSRRGWFGTEAFRAHMANPAWIQAQPSPVLPIPAGTTHSSTFSITLQVLQMQKTTMLQLHSLKRWAQLCTTHLASSGCPCFIAADHLQKMPCPFWVSAVSYS